MKKILMLLCLGITLTSCSKEKQSITEISKNEYSVGYYTIPLQIIKIDSCEYLFGDWGSSTTLTHKGNCKNCLKLN